MVGSLQKKGNAGSLSREKIVLGGGRSDSSLEKSAEIAPYKFKRKGASPDALTNLLGKRKKKVVSLSRSNQKKCGSGGIRHDLD